VVSKKTGAKTMKSKSLLWLLTAVLLTTAPTAEAQQVTIPRIGYLAGPSVAVVTARTEAFRQGLRALGYVEGKNIVIEWRSAEGKADRLTGLAAELVRLRVDAIVTSGPSVTRAAKEATSTIPIVMSQDPDPVAAEFVASLARPGGNITGLSTLASEVGGKRLELLKEIVPKLSRVAVLGTSTTPSNAQQRREIELAAGPLGVKLQYLDILSPKDIEATFQAARNGRADAVLALGSNVLNTQRTRLAEAAVKSRLPVIYGQLEFVESGGLINYSASLNDLARRAATYVDKILKGAMPADLPVEQPTKFEFVINLKAAKQIGLTIPPNVLVRADRVIK
jgi:putative tryptophan/tyrosine transport system substrate-binding protein